MPSFDIVVIGAGAAGLVAAARAAECGACVLLLEKNKQAGVKILMSGGTRCNLTQNTDNRGIVREYGEQGNFLHSSLAALSVADSIALFNGLGVATKLEEYNKIFPVSNSAAEVRDALVSWCEQVGVTIGYLEPVLDVRRIDNSTAGGSPEAQPQAPAANTNASIQTLRFETQTIARTITTRAIILTTGGLSFPGSGTTGDGYKWATAFGHTLMPTRPALVPLTTNAEWVKSLRGITLPDIGVTIVEPNSKGTDFKTDDVCLGLSASEPPVNKKLGAKVADTTWRPQPPAILAQRRGSLLFAHFGLTGPVALDVSRAVSGHPHKSRLLAQLDLLPDEKESLIEQELQTAAAQSGKKQLGHWLAQKIARRVVEQLLRLAEIPDERTLAEVSKDERRRVVTLCKALPIPLTGTLGYEKAEVTAGGISLDEVDSRTLQSKLVPGLFFAGEVLDLDGPIGGYNFQAAWSTGWLAGQSAAAGSE